MKLSRSLLAVLLGASAVVVAQPASAQIPSSLERCLPYPTLAEEIRDILDITPEWKVPKRVAVVESVELRGATTLPPALRDQIVASLLHREFELHPKWSSHWLLAVGEIELRGFLQRHGYLNARVYDKEAEVILGTPDREHVAVTFQIDEGLQYRLAEIRFTTYPGADRPPQFPYEKLRGLFPIRDGEILDTRPILRGLEELKLLYGEHGYIDFVSQPDFESDDANHRVTLLIELEPGLQFRIGAVEFRNLDPAIVKQLKWVPTPGDVFNNADYAKFFEENKALIPCAQPENAEILRDLRRGTVRIIFQIPTCQELWLRLLRCAELRVVGR